MKAMILAAGYGTRFRPVTRVLPKPMIPVLNRPLLGWVTESCLASGFNEIIVNLHYLPESIRSYLEDEYRDRASFEFSEEEEILGTGGALRRVRDLLDDEFVLVNGDTIQNPPFRELVATRRGQQALACLLLRHVPEDDSFTPVWFREGWITGFGSGRGKSLMFAGAHALSHAIVDLLPDKEVSALTTEVYIPLSEQPEPRLAGIVRDDYWFDVGTPLRYMHATTGLLEALRNGGIAAPRGSRLHESSLLHDSSEVRGEVGFSVVGAGTRVDADSRIERSVLWENVSIGRGGSVVGSIVAHDVTLPSGAVVENVLVMCAVSEQVETEEAERVGDWLVRPVDPSRPSRFQAGGLFADQTPL